MKRQILLALNEARRNGRAVVRAVELSSGEERLFDRVSDFSELDIKAFPDLQTDAWKAVCTDQSTTIEIDGRSWFLTVYNPPLELAVVGAVHISQPLCAIAKLAGYQVRVIDPREGFATMERFPGVDVSHDWPDEALVKAPLGPRSALAALTHDPKIDDPALVAALRSNCFYIGALGSRKTQAGRRERLKQHGFSDAQIDRIRGPIGLAIGARSPAEIAISILAEITQTLRKGRAPEAVGLPAAT